ncbi:MAG: response regulator [Herbinix sp.]|nr:response regulator [Herbinix sp.]
MIKVLIVDDEYLQRELVKTSINWKAIDMTIIGEAEDGREALKICNISSPDIIIMDINIPFINGIDASKQIKEFLPDVQIIILTAYGEFDYAKQALEFGAIGFVLKPLDPDELYKKLLQSKDNMEYIWNQRDSILELQKENLQRDKEQFLLSCLSDLQENAEKMSRWNAYNIMVPKYYCTIDIRYIDVTTRKERQNEFKEYIEERFPDCEVVYINRDIIIILLSDQKEEQFKFELQALCMHLEREINNLFIEAGSISEIHENIDELHIAYQESYISLKKGSANKGIARYESQSLLSLMKSISYSSQDFLREIRFKNYDEIYKQIRVCFKKLNSEKNPYQATLYISMDILVNFTLYMMDLGIDTSGKLEGERELLMKMSSMGKTKEVGELICATLKSGINLIENHSLSSGKRKVEDARKFIEKNYQHYDLNLNMIASQVVVNPSYLSYIFKKEYGYTLSRYIINVRMEQAKKIIKNEVGLSVIDLSKKVGYTDEYYFSKSFKNYYGISPSKYIEDKNIV